MEFIFLESIQFIKKQHYFGFEYYVLTKKMHLVET